MGFLPRLLQIVTNYLRIEITCLHPAGNLQTPCLHKVSIATGRCATAKRSQNAISRSATPATRLYPLSPGCFPTSKNPERGYVKKQLLLACLTLLVFSRPMQAEQPRTGSGESDAAAEERPRGEDRIGTAHQRRKLRDELDSYSRKAYPDQDDVDRRRRLMHERMQERLSNPESGNISITRSEAQLRMPKLARHFDQIDASGDGEITMEEINAWRQQLPRGGQKAIDAIESDDPPDAN